MTETKVPYKQLIETFERILGTYDFNKDRAHLAATLFAKASLDGVASHGLNRFPSFLDMIDKGYVHTGVKPELVDSAGFFERWDGNLGPGNLNAHHCMNRAIHLAHNHGMGCVALRNTNHWMRAGNYGWQAVDAQCLGICFTNTKPNMPAWGGSQPILGNNPMVIAIPREDGPLVLDMAMAQFSYGKMETYERREQSLPYEAGFDEKGQLTRDPSSVIENELALPIGLWKGAGMSLMLDLLASVLSEGKSTSQIGEQDEEYGISQFFMCFYLPKLGIEKYPEQKLNEIVEHFKASTTFKGSDVRYPGEQTLKTRNENKKKGVPVDSEIWENVKRMDPSTDKS